MPRLNSRQKQIPGGYRFYIAPLRWTSTPWSSFEVIVTEATAVLRANPHVAKNLGWNLDHDAMADRIDDFNASIAKSQGWKEYYSEGGSGGAPSFPFQQCNQGILQKLKNVAAGSSTILEWIKSGTEAVAPEISEKRAGICAACPMNQQGDLTSIFTVPVSNAIRAALNTRSEWKLSTTQDEKLNVCGICNCPLKLLVHCPIEMKMSKIPKDVFENLPAHCWVKVEANTKGLTPQ
jgi:hypothetical protein